jgi:hypothetical protein
MYSKYASNLFGAGGCDFNSLASARAVAVQTTHTARSTWFAAWLCVMTTTHTALEVTPPVFEVLFKPVW